MRTAIWLLSVSLSYICVEKVEGRIPVFEEVMKLAKKDMMIVEWFSVGSVNP